MMRMSGRAVLQIFVVLQFGIVLLSISTPLHAQTAAINDLKGKIFDAKMAQQVFAAGLKHCSELDGTNFYFQPRDRVLSLEEYHRSLANLATQGVFNPETKRPWTQEDANARWVQVQKQANSDKDTCALVASLPDLQKKLQELQQTAATQNNPPPKQQNNPPPKQ
jgi:hypothetical protein